MQMILLYTGHVLFVGDKNNKNLWRCGIHTVAVINAMCFLTFYSPDLKKRRRKKGQINLYSKLKTGGLEAFQTAIFNGGGMEKKNCRPCQSVSEHNVCFQSFGL